MHYLSYKKGNSLIFTENRLSFTTNYRQAARIFYYGNKLNFNVKSPKNQYSQKARTLLNLRVKTYIRLSAWLTQ